MEYIRPPGLPCSSIVKCNSVFEHLKINNIPDSFKIADQHLKTIDWKHYYNTWLGSLYTSFTIPKYNYIKCGFFVHLPQCLIVIIQYWKENFFFFWNICKHHSGRIKRNSRPAAVTYLTWFVLIRDRVSFAFTSILWSKQNWWFPGILSKSRARIQGFQRFTRRNEKSL